MTREERIDISEYDYDADKGIWSKYWEKFLEGHVNKYGYVYLSLKCLDGKRRFFYLHRVMWYMAYGPIPDGYEINHIDENKQNNALSNLNLMTHKENCNHGTRIERIAAKKRGRKLTEEQKAKLRGVPKPYIAELKSKPVVAVDEDNNVAYEFASTREAGRQGFCQACVVDCCNNCYWKLGNYYKGYYWYYKDEYEKLMWEEVMIGET